MINIVVVADDLAGANDTGAILSQNGFKVATILKAGYMEQSEDYDVLRISTNSRGISRDEAYGRIQKTAALSPRGDSIPYSKRIDSTLRGNVGAEIDSTPGYLRENYRAMVAASFPGSGQTSIGDILLTNGVPLQMTEAVNNPTSPVHTSRITEIIKQQSQYPVGYIGPEQVVESSGKLLGESLKQTEEHRIIVVGVRTTRGTDAIAACYAASGLKAVVINPSFSTAALAGNLLKRKKKAIQKKLLCGIDSASDLTRQQLQHLKKDTNPLVARIRAAELLDEDRHRAEIERVVEEVRAAGESHGTTVVTTTESKDDAVDLSKTDGAKYSFTKECAGVITDAIAQAPYDLIGKMDGRTGGVYASRGDVAAAFRGKLEAFGFYVRREVTPLIIYSNTIGGNRQGLPTITKGSLMERGDTLMQCMEYSETVV